MIELIVGSKGKGKTKILLEKADKAIKEATGSVVYVDKSSQHMYELSNRIRLINVSGFPVNSEDGFVGFISGIISQDHDLERVKKLESELGPGIVKEELGLCIKRISMHFHTRNSQMSV